MKISPISQGTPAPTASLNQTSAPPSRVEAAKAAFLGHTKVTPSDTYTDPAILKAQQNIRKIKMRTNVSPDREYDSPQSTSEETGEEFSTLEANEPNGKINDAPESGISDPSSDAEPVTEVTKPLSPQFAALARQRRALQVKEREIADRERRLASNPPQDDGKATLARLKSSPLAVLQEAGVTYDELTQAILANPSGNNPDIHALKEEIKSLKEGFDKTLSERDARTEQEALREMRRNVDRLVATGDDFEMIRETGSQAEVTELIRQIYKIEGTVLDESEAAVLVEEELLKEAEKIARIKKLRARFAPAETQPANQVVEYQPRQMRTLTNRDGTRPAMSARERALRAFRGEPTK
jgi:hypothetical protein